MRHAACKHHAEWQQHIEVFGKKKNYLDDIAHTRIELVGICFVR